MDMLHDWEGRNGEVIFPHVLLQSLALIVTLMLAQLGEAGVSDEERAAAQVAAAQGDDGKMGRLLDRLQPGSWCLLFDDEHGPARWTQRVADAPPPETVVAWECSSPEMSVRRYSEALAEACHDVLLLPKFQLERTKSAYMDLIAAEIAVLPSIRVWPDVGAVPSRQPPPHVLEFCLDSTVDGLLDRAGREVGYSEALERLVALQGRLGPPVVDHTAVVKGDTGDCAERVAFCDGAEALRSQVQLWGGRADFCPLTVQLRQPAFAAELCCVCVRTRKPESPYQPIYMVVKHSERGAQPGAATMRLEPIIDVRGLRRTLGHSRGDSSQEEFLPAGLASLAAAIPRLFPPQQVDSMPVVRFDFLVLLDSDRDCLTFYLNEMQTNLSARLLVDQEANPIRFAEAWAEAAYLCLQRPGPETPTAHPDGTSPKAPSHHNGPPTCRNQR
jgi:hypothetical protein